VSVGTPSPTGPFAGLNLFPKLDTAHNGKEIDTTMSRFFATLVLAAASLSASPVFEVTYNNGAAGNDSRYIIGITQITLKGSGPAQTFDSMCFDFVDHISSGQQYLGEAVKLTDYAKGNEQTLYDLAGFAYYGMHNLPAIPGLSPFEVLQGIQYGVWDLMDPNESQDNDIYGGYKYTKELDAFIDTGLKHPAILSALDLQLKGDFPHVLDNLYVVQGVGRDAGLQKFIIGGNIPAGVPEPGSMCLMGGGLLGLAMAIRRRTAR
jgi:hypothetical protein